MSDGRRGSWRVIGRKLITVTGSNGLVPAVFDDSGSGFLVSIFSDFSLGRNIKLVFLLLLDSIFKVVCSSDLTSSSTRNGKRAWVRAKRKKKTVTVTATASLAILW